MVGQFNMSALLCPLAQVTGEPVFKDTVEDILHYVSRDLRDKVLQLHLQFNGEDPVISISVGHSPIRMEGFTLPRMPTPFPVQTTGTRRREHFVCGRSLTFVVC